jgi:hypothetical protein
MRRQPGNWNAPLVILAARGRQNLNGKPTRRLAYGWLTRTGRAAACTRVRTHTLSESAILSLTA